MLNTPITPILGRGYLLEVHDEYYAPATMIDRATSSMTSTSQTARQRPALTSDAPLKLNDLRKALYANDRVN